MVLPTGADAMAARIGPVTSASAVANTRKTVLRSDRADPADASGISVLAPRTNLLRAVHGAVRSGSFPSPTTARFLTVALGFRAASRLGFDRVRTGQESRQVHIDGHGFTVVGILDPLPLAPASTPPAREPQIEAVRAALPATLHPQLPGLVQVSRPSGSLAAV
ncbi:hypothetical protein ACFV7R_40100 [Streptomyces sp. NPDC059866]|uniref:hypothetical protein n=1 Tax=Streptomyces sp. NPDC059866 TaxID=3346978 RepID=UPI0036479528